MFEQRCVYCCTVEGKPRYFDPILTLQNLRSVAKEDLGALVARAEAARKENATDEEFFSGLSAEFVLHQAVIVVFGLPEFNQETGKGTTVAESIAIWNHFCAFMDDLKKSGVM